MPNVFQNNSFTSNLQFFLNPNLLVLVKTNLLPKNFGSSTDLILSSPQKMIKLLFKSFNHLLRKNKDTWPKHLDTIEDRTDELKSTSKREMSCCPWVKSGSNLLYQRSVMLFDTKIRETIVLAKSIITVVSSNVSKTWLRKPLAGDMIFF